MTARRLLLLALALGVLLLLTRLPAPELRGLRKVEDFGAYWSAASLNAKGANPYAVEELRPLQQAIDPNRSYILYMFNPPWTLGLLFPWSLFDFTWARLLWLAVQVAVLGACAGRLWQLYGGPPRTRVLAFVLCFTFFPTLQLLALGQVTVLTLAGAVGFVVWEREQPWRAGVAAGLTLIKPHLVVVLWVPLGLNCLWRRRWPVLLAAATTVLALTSISWVCNPQVLQQYVAMWGQNPTSSWIPPTPGSLLRLLLGPEKFWLAFVFPTLGMAWAAIHWWRRRDRWDWAQELPALLLACFLTAAYGWAYDLVILLPALVVGAASAAQGRAGTAALAAYLPLTVLAIAMNIAHCEEYLFFWIAPAVLTGYQLLRPGPFVARSRVVSGH
jgi:hypothetical protein